MTPCEYCGVALPQGARSSRRFCSKACSNRAYRAAGRGAIPEKQREYSRASYARTRMALLQSIGERLCIECGAALPPTARLRRQFCSRRCINRRSLRERRDERNEATRRRQQRIRDAGGVGVSPRDWRRLVNRFGGQCAYCDRTAKLTMDHVVPVSRGGQHAIGNILPACQSCNSAKRDDLLIHWRNNRAQARLAA